MKNFAAAFRAELIKVRRSRVSLTLTAALFILPFVSGLFMIILKDPDAARATGVIGMKAQIVTAGVADWPTFFDIVAQGMAIGGFVVFSMITSWVFGREFTDHTTKEWLAILTPRESIITAKLLLTFVWIIVLTFGIYIITWVVGSAVDIPGYSLILLRSQFVTMMTVSILNFLLMPFVALMASVYRGVLAPIGLTILLLAIAQVVAVLGWGGWFPWSIPMMYSGMAGPRTEHVGSFSYVIMFIVFVAGVAFLYNWWRKADHSK